MPDKGTIKKYDFIIVGAGFAGATCARKLSDKGYRCLIIEERPFVGGNCVTDILNDIEVHFFGAHVLHTNNEDVWHFLNYYDNIIPCKYSPICWNDGKIYSLPFGMEMLSNLYETAWPFEAEQALSKDMVDNTDIKTVKEYCLKNFGKKVYETIIKGFYDKLFGEDCSELPYQSIFERKIDILTYGNTFYPEKLQGIPENGYTKLIENIIGDDIDILLSRNFLENKDKYMSLGNYTIYTGEIDKFFNYCIGALDWISADFTLNDEYEQTSNLTGAPVVYFSSKNPEWYRTTEHKWLREPIEKTDKYNEHTYVTYETFRKWEIGMETYYPLYTERSLRLYSRYLDRLHREYPNVILCGRKAQYTFDHICDVIEKSFSIVDKFPYKN